MQTLQATSASSSHAKSVFLLQVLNIFFFLVNIVVNYLSNSLPINGKTAGELSDQYPNLFTPAPLTFSIWGVIYLSLFLFCLFQISNRVKPALRTEVESVVERMGVRFIITNICGMGWLLAWHYEHVTLSVGIMLVYLVTLIDIHRIFRIGLATVSRAEKYFVHIPFSIYLGWISVATIANITTLLVAYDWQAGVSNPVFWTVAMIGVVILLTLWILWKRNNIFYGFTIIWALVGIILARYAETPVALPVVYTAIGGIACIIVGSLLRVKKWMVY